MFQKLPGDTFAIITIVAINCQYLTICFLRESNMSYVLLGFPPVATLVCTWRGLSPGPVATSAGPRCEGPPDIQYLIYIHNCLEMVATFAGPRCEVPPRYTIYVSYDMSYMLFRCSDSENCLEMVALTYLNSKTCRNIQLEQVQY